MSNNGPIKPEGVLTLAGRERKDLIFTHEINEGIIEFY